MDMIHFDKDQCKTYIQGRASIPQRKLLEDHIVQCETCLSLYLSCLEECESILPAISDDKQWTEDIIKYVISMNTDFESKKHPPQKLFTKQIIHYVIAASITLILTVSGAFQQIIIHSESITTQATSTLQPSLSEKITSKSSSWFQQLIQHASLKGD